MKKRRIALRILKRIEEAGYAAYLVGGCVRDRFLGKESTDYDICTSATPEKIQQLFQHTIPTGYQHGTVTVLEEGIPFEVTTFRKEAGYVDHRRPSQVTFVSDLKTDLSRRDFTMNAMAQDRHGRMIDPFDGRKDIQSRQIRCVGKPIDRFSEDALRIIRAARFAAQFCFSLDDEVAKAIEVRKDRVGYLAIERVVAELEKIWVSSTSSIGLEIFWKYDLWSHLPVFRYWNWKEVSEQEIKAFDWTQDRFVCWSFLLDLGQVDQQSVQRECRCLTLPKKVTKAIVDCFRLANQWEPSMTEKQLKQFLLHFGIQTTERAYQLVSFRCLQQPSPLFRQKLSELWETMPVRSISDLSIDGKDLLQHTQQKAGPWVHKTLQYLLVRVALGEIPNEQSILLREGGRFAEQVSTNDPYFR